MKKSFVCLIISLMLVCTVFTACGSASTKDDQVTGSWELSSIATGASTVTAEKYIESAGLSDTPQVIFKDDGTIEFTGLGKDVDPNGKWTGSDGKYVIDDGSAKLDCTINDDGEMEIVYPKEDSEDLSTDMTMVFKKATEN
ncbi:MAG: hypothetical protein VB031_00155 [Eubacteriaceae bacterium]|nr:hypothetical protein [Eubacteriaceae bacterium]